MKELNKKETELIIKALLEYRDKLHNQKPETNNDIKGVREELKDTIALLKKMGGL